MDLTNDKAPSSARTRTVEWQDPLIGAQAARTMSGIEYLRAMANGELPPPPFAALVGGNIETVEEGRVVFTLVPAEYHYNPIGTVHGGLLCTLCDSAMGCAVHSLLPAGSGYTSLEVKTNFVRPVTIKTGLLRCEGKVIHFGGKIATAEATVRDEAGKLYAHATTTCLILRSESAN